jgi:hypothetical protein
VFCSLRERAENTYVLHACIKAYRDANPLGCDVVDGGESKN